MIAIVLAAGQGSRLRPLTLDRPKCLVELNGKTILQYQIDVFQSSGINSIWVVGGYKANMINNKDVTLLVNENYMTTNMVSTLFCAEQLMHGEEDVIISYGDIVFEEHVLKKLLDSCADVSVTYDTEWRKYWSERMSNPLEDAETFKLNNNNSIKELGKKPNSYNEVNGQYIGLIKLRASKVRQFVAVRKELEKSEQCDQRDFDNMYMTSYLQYLIDLGWDIKGIPIQNGWAEIDCVTDIEVASKFCKIINPLI